MIVYVIIITYNPKKWIEKCLSSLKQSSCIVQTIVVDNNSSDGSIDYIKKNFSEVILIENNVNLGFGAANNLGIKKAYEEGADYVFLLNQDAWIEPDTIEKLVSAHQKEPKYGVVSPIHLNGKGDALDDNFSFYIAANKCKGLQSDIFLKKLKEKVYPIEFVNAAAWLLSRECIIKVGGFNPSFFHYGEDDNYIQRVKYHNLEVGILTTALIFHDRDKRPANEFFANKMIVYERNLIYKASNPNKNFSFSFEYKNNLKSLIKSIGLVRFSLIRDCYLKFRILQKIDKKRVVENRVESKINQTAFL